MSFVVVRGSDGNAYLVGEMGSVALNLMQQAKRSIVLVIVPSTATGKLFSTQLSKYMQDEHQTPSHKTLVLNGTLIGNKVEFIFISPETVALVVKGLVGLATLIAPTLFISGAGQIALDVLNQVVDAMQRPGEDLDIMCTLNKDGKVAGGSIASSITNQDYVDL